VNKSRWFWVVTEMTEATPLPEATPVSAPFWQALTEHRILVQYSPSLGRYVF